MRKALLFLLLFAAPLSAQAVPLVVKGDTVTVKIERAIIVLEDRLVVKSLPFSVNASPGAGIYFWTYPPTITALDKGDSLEVTAAPKGPLTISVKCVTVDWDKKQFLTRVGSVSFDVLEPGPGPVPPIPPKPDPPVPPAPIPVPGFRALIIYETAEITPSLSDVMSGIKTNEYMREKGVKGGYLKLDKDANVSKLDAWVGLAWKWKTDHPLPLLIISNGTTGYVGPIPKGPDGKYSPQLTLDLMRKIGEGK